MKQQQEICFTASVHSCNHYNISFNEILVVTRDLLAGTLDKHTCGKLPAGKLDSVMAAITSEFATAAKAKAHTLAHERQPSMKKLAADAAEVPLLCRLTSVACLFVSKCFPFCTTDLTCKCCTLSSVSLYYN